MSSDTPPRPQKRRLARGLSAIASLVGTGLVITLMLLWVFYHDAVEQAFNWVPGWTGLLALVLWVLVVTGVIVRSLTWQKHPRLAFAAQRVSLVLLAAATVALALTTLSGQLPDTSHYNPGELR